MHLLMMGLLALEGAIAEPDARALVDRWLAAQNGGDFSSYERLFASKFTGVRRSGPRTVRLDREGWLKDRGRMFKKPMTVAVSDVKVKAGVVSFTQSFAQGSYKDSGPKQLVLVREGGALKIASEAMLRSEIVVQPKSEKFHWVVDGGLLLDPYAGENWAVGPITVDTRDPVVASRRAEPKKLPPALSAWQGRAVRLFDAAGTPCEAKVSGFRVVSRAIPHFGTREEWKGLAEKEIAKQAWEMGGKELIADLDKPCKDALWAQSAALPAVASDAGQEVDATLRGRVLAELRKTPAWKTIQKSYLESPQDGVKNWDALDGLDVRVRRFHARIKGQEVSLISATLSLWNGCGEFQGDLWGLFEERAGKLILRNTPGHDAVRPVAMVDSDGDGNSEIVFEPVTGDFGTEKGRVLLDGEKWDHADRVEVPYLDCPC